MKIFLLALVCFAFTQVYGSELEDRIKEALDFFDLHNYATNLQIKFIKDDLSECKILLKGKPSIYIQELWRYQNESIDEVKIAAKNLTARAKEGKLPQEVIKCIAKEEQATITAISPYAPKFETNVKEFHKPKPPLIEQEEKNLSKIEASLPERYKKGVADIKSCKDVQSVEKTSERLFREYSIIANDCENIARRAKGVLREFERGATVWWEKASFSIRLTKKVGIIRMTECFPKTA